MSPTPAALRPLVIYHANCADGFSAAWCFWHKYGDGVEFLPASHGSKPPPCAGREVYLLDFAYPRAVVAAMLHEAKQVWLIDHHQTALQDLADLPGLQQYTDLQRSGAVLAWDFLFAPQACPPLLAHVQDRDLWRFQLESTREICSALFSYDFSFALWDSLQAGGQEAMARLKGEGEVLRRKEEKDIAALVQACRRKIQIGGYWVLVANVPWLYASEVGQRLAAENPQGFAACYWDSAKGRKFELRSGPQGADVSVIAREYGGGGHKHAAGFMVGRTHRLAKL